jgi:dolichol-phosphate mannosyltransferase
MLNKGVPLVAEVSIVIPTYNEVENIRNLIEKLVALDGDLGIVVVDDNSPDGTAETVEELAQKWGSIVLHRRQGKLGIGSAIREGMERALSFLECHYIVTMDADFSHNPEDLPALLEAAKEGDADLIQGSRYIKGGGVVGWNFRRKLQSRVANLIGKLLFSLPNEVTTYFRVYTRESAKIVVDKVSANKYEFAVASALAIKDHGLKIKEVPIVFVNRTQGRSKLKASDTLVWLAIILRIFVSRQLSKIDLMRFFKFCLVGGSGILVNMGLLWILTEYLGLFYVLSAAVSIETSILTNFTLNDLWTFRDRRHLGSNIAKRALKYNLTCGVGVALNLGILTLLTEVFGVYYLISNLFGIAAATLWNYGGSTKWAWKIRASSKV